jgi:hypothetical protein
VSIRDDWRDGRRDDRVLERLAVLEATVADMAARIRRLEALAVLVGAASARTLDKDIRERTRSSDYERRAA